MPPTTKNTTRKTTTTNRKKPGVRVSNQVTIDPNNPIPFEIGGNHYSFIHSTEYIPFLPPKDDWARQLLETRLTSTTHNACVTTKRDYCAGIGFQDRDGNELDKRIIEWLKALNLRNQNVVAINQAIFESLFTWGNAPVEVVRLTVAGTKRLFVYPHNFMEWRLCRPNEDDIITHAVQSKLFLRDGVVTADDIKKSKQLPIYNPMRTEAENWVKDEKGVERTMFWLKNPVAGFPHYGLPSAVASMIFQLLEYKGGRYNLDNFENNMVTSAILALKGNLSPEEANKIARQIINTHTGDGKRGRVAVVSSEEGIDGSEFHSFDTQKEGSYIEADDKWTQKIILANQWDAILAGIISPSTLGKGSGFITKILEMKMNNVVKPAQRKLIDEVWTHIFSIAEAWLGLPFKQYNLEVANTIDISGLTDVDITPAVTRNEVRKAKGLPEDPSEKGKEYMKATGPAPKPEGGSDVSA